MYWFLAAIPIVLADACPDVVQTHKEEAKRYLEYLDKKVCQAITEDTFAYFNYITNTTEYNRQKFVEQDAKGNYYLVKPLRFDWASFNDSYMYRQAKDYDLFRQPDDPQLSQNFSDILSKMGYIHATDVSNICQYKNRTNCGEAVWLTTLNIYSNTRDTDELAYYWNETNKDVPRLLRPLYEPFVNLNNKISKLHGYANAADEDISNYEEPKLDDFECVMMDLWKQLEPIYKHYHAFNRNRLREIYGEAAVSKKGPIPLHLYDLSFGMEIEANIDEGKPYPDKPSTDVTKELKKQCNTTYDMAKIIERFYHSLGLGNLPDSFWKGSVFSEPEDRVVNCDESLAFDFKNGKDFRMFLCADVNQYWMKSMTHEMGHIYSFVGSQNQPCCFKDPGSAGFTEGLADMMMALIMSYGNLQSLNLVPKDAKRERETEMNDLFALAADGIGMMPYVLLVDLWRFNIYRSNISPDNYNKAYWDLRKLYQGVVPPYPRGEEYLDAGSVPHVANNNDYVCYFIENIVMYQMIEHICIKASEFDPSNPNSKPLHECNIYNSTIAGDILRETYALGSSKPWTESLRIASGKPFMDAGSLLRYFDPLYKWLVEENKRTGEYIGWE